MKIFYELTPESITKTKNIEKILNKIETKKQEGSITITEYEKLIRKYREELNLTLRVKCHIS